MRYVRVIYVGDIILTIMIFFNTIIYQQPKDMPARLRGSDQRVINSLNRLRFYHNISPREYVNMRSGWNEYRNQVARKEHWCTWCKTNTIKRGTEYVAYVGRWEGDFQYWKMHLECLEAFEDIRDQCEGFICENPHDVGAYCDECKPESHRYGLKSNRPMRTIKIVSPLKKSWGT